MYYKNVILLIFFTSLFSSLFGIDFDTLKDYTIDNSKVLDISRLNIDISKSEYEYINSERYPSIVIGISTERSKGLSDDLNESSYVGDNSVSSSSLYKTYSYISLNYSIFDFGRLYYKTKTKTYNIEKKKNEYCIELTDISQKLLDTYYNTKLAQIKDKYLNQILKFTNELYQYYIRLNKVGNIQKTEVVTNAIQVANLYNKISDNNRILVENFEKLSNISNFDFKHNENLEALSFSKQYIKREFEETSLAKKYFNEIREKEAEINLIEASYYPQINFFGKYDFYGYDANSFRSTLGNFEENSYKYGFNISWQIFDGYKTKAQMKKAMQELAQLNLKYQQAKKDFDTQLNTLEKTHKFYTKIIEKNAKVLNLSNENLDMSLRLNKIGELDKSSELNSIIKKLYAELEYKQAQETISYKLIKKDIMLNGDKECIVR